MTGRQGTLVALAGVLVAAAVTGCAGSPETGWLTDPGLTALGWAASARDVDANVETIEALFGAVEDLERRAALLDGMSVAGENVDARVLDTVWLEPLDRVAVDLELDLPGGGTAEWSIQFQRRDDKTLQAIWFAGPGTEWPPPRHPHIGSSTSAAPPAPR